MMKGQKEVDGIIVKWWAEGPTSGYRDYHTRHRIEGKTFDSLSKDVMAIEGVTNVFKGHSDVNYQIEVFIGSCFTWDEIEPLVLKEIQKVLPATIYNYVNSKCFHCGL